MYGRGQRDIRAQDGANRATRPRNATLVLQSRISPAACKSGPAATGAPQSRRPDTAPCRAAASVDCPPAAGEGRPRSSVIDAFQAQVH
ncbi:hypothetical protein BIWAKO_00297 [Bosea sp. BIWAKO-01]|nr:hypothetical protein BIWAKO_00297 [Bosea sp. BIWAKO-01]